MSNIDFEFGRNIGATHYIDDMFYKRVNGEWYVYFGISWDRSDNTPSFNNGNCKPIPPANPWTIHNNDKPLCELSDEQYGKLLRAAHNGGEVEFLVSDGVWRRCSVSPSNITLVYRIKPKSERDEFVERCISAAKKNDADCDVTFSQAIFDAIQRGDIKAPEVRK